MFRRRFSAVAVIVKDFSRMISMIWEAQPFYFAGLASILVVQGLVPLASAWLTKILFDLITQNQHRQLPFNLTQILFFFLLAQAGIIIASQFTTPLNQYLNAELGRHLSLKIKANLYQKLNSFTGLTYFEEPGFNNTIQLVSNGAYFNPLQSIISVSNLLQSIVTIIAFMGVIFAFNLLLALVVSVTVLPQFYIQFKFSRQRFNLVLNNSPKERRATYYGDILSRLSYAKEVRLFNLGPFFLQSFLQVTREIQQSQHIQRKRELRGQLWLVILASLVTTGAFAIVIIQAFSGRLTIGDVSLYMSAVTNVQSAMLGIAITISQINGSLLFYKQYVNVLALPQPLSESAAVLSVPSLASGITLRDVSFRYNDRQFIYSRRPMPCSCRLKWCRENYACQTPHTPVRSNRRPDIVGWN